MGVLRVPRAAAGAGVRAAAGLSERWDSLGRVLVALAALDLTLHLGQHLAGGVPSPRWFFVLGVVGATGLWATAALWPRGSEAARNAVLAILGLGLVWGGLGMHAVEAAADGLTLTHATGIAAGVLGVAMLGLAGVRAVRIRAG